MADTDTSIRPVAPGRVIEQRAHLPLHSEALDQLLPALVEASKKFPEIPRSREVTVKSDKGTYKFAYAPLDAIAKVINPPLLENNLVIAQTPVRYVDGDFLRTTLWHAPSAQFLASEVEIHSSSRGTSAQYGAALTYSRRYGESALLGITTETDNDDPDNASRGAGNRQQRGNTQRQATGEDVPKITPGQVRQLRQAIIAGGRKEPDVVAFYGDSYGISKLEGLPASAFDRVMAALKKPLPRNHQPEE